MVLRAFELLVRIWEIFRELLLAIYRDVYGIYLIKRADLTLKRIQNAKGNVHRLFRRNVKLQPNKPCIVFEDQTWTFQMMEDYSNQVADIFAHRFQLKKGDTVALYMENRPEFVGLWLGLSKVGVITALINTNLRSRQLVHSISVARSKALIFGSEFDQNVKAIESELEPSLTFITDSAFSQIDKAFDLKSLFKTASTDPFESEQEITGDDVILYFYTSGTTGLPKPAIVKQSRFYGSSVAFQGIGNLKRDDVIYVSLPIYHANGGMIGIGLSLVCGCTLVLRRKFSASAFWKDCVEHKCTIFTYVGEICRFLVNQPVSAYESQHCIRKAFGNGMRLNVWQEFNKRFKIKCMEFYAASEGNCTIANITCKTGACGFVPLLHDLISIPPTFVIKIDDQMNPIRDENGFCIKCKRGEPGLFVGLIGNTPRTAYSGYAHNEEASKKKIIENVFKQGQRAFNSGDLMVCDRLGYMYFCDRLGDTYRWRGENVSTIEVENTVSSHLNSKEVIVYGVEVPGQEGKAGMAAIQEQSVDNLDTLGAKIVQDLPPYARPVFIRLVKEIDYTGSFKVQKLKLVQEAYDPNKSSDKIFYFDAKEQLYKLLNNETYEKIVQCKLRI